MQGEQAARAGKIPNRGQYRRDPVHLQSLRCDFLQAYKDFDPATWDRTGDTAVRAPSPKRATWLAFFGFSAAYTVSQNLHVNFGAAPGRLAPSRSWTRRSDRIF